MSHHNRHNLQSLDSSGTTPAGGGAITEEGDEQTETDELYSQIWTWVHEITNATADTRKEGEADRDRFLALLAAWSRQQTARILERLHRTDGEGLPKRDYDNVTDEAIDAELAALRVGLESDND